MTAAAVSAQRAHAWAVVVADGDVDIEHLRRVVAGRDSPPFLIAADGGARHVLAAGLTPHLVVGDGDSLDASTGATFARRGIEVRRVEPAKDESDTELCLLAAVERGARRIDVVGALGGRRPEHAVANLLLLAHPAFDGLEVTIVTGGSSIRRLGTTDGPGTLALHGRPGEFVSLFSLDSMVSGVRTRGLRFPLNGGSLVPGPARGLSNELIGERATVRTERGRLLVVHTRRATGEGTP